ncbi:hypothetical protein MAR_006786 [Mya arenaria]|uniref:Uncharacterized protein n=1 Tax=Mya arenaria TaxID=6604 RepID=A0ABY7DD96_MYAAR|nr:hypothetical protein MAR_006786 [Mya arenaria]
MHGILLGITKKLLSFWLDNKHSSEMYYIGKRVNEVDNKLMQITPPHSISRLPRKLSTTMKHWKASELRAWLLFYSLPCLKDILPDIYLKHYSLLVEAVFILLTEGISHEDLHRADQILHMFLKTAPALYHDNIMGLNMHNLLHLTTCVRNWGPLWAWSCFSFESFNGQIKKTVHGTGNVCLQIFWALMAQKYVEQSFSEINDTKTLEFVQTLSNKTQHDETKQCIVRKKYTFSKGMSFPEQIRNQLESLAGTSDISKYMKVKKCVVNGKTIYSKSCMKVKSRNSYTVLVSDTSNSARYIEIQYFIIETSTGKVYAIGKELAITSHVLQANAPHLKVVEVTREEKVEKATNIQSILVSFTVNDHHIISDIPNSVEAGSVSMVTAGSVSMITAGSVLIITAGSVSMVTAGSVSMITAGSVLIITAGSVSMVTAGSVLIVKAGSASMVTAGFVAEAEEKYWSVNLWDFWFNI